MRCKCFFNYFINIVATDFFVQEGVKQIKRGNGQADHFDRADAADWAARFDRLRKTNRGAPCNTGLPAVPDTATGIDAANPDTSVTAIKIDDLEVLVQNSVRGKALQDWVSAQAKVETSE